MEPEILTTTLARVLPRHERRQGVTETGVPLKFCFDPCNDPVLRAQQHPPTPDSCNDDAFTRGINSCRVCIQHFAPEILGEITSGTTELAKLLDYCDPDKQIEALLSSVASLSASQSDLQNSLSSLGYTASETTTNTTQTTGPGVTVTPTRSVVSVTVSYTPSDTSTRSPASTSTSTDTESGGAQVSVIAPAVVLPVVAILMGIIFGMLFLRRRRRKRTDGPTEEPEQELEGDQVKLELDEDRIRSELDGDHPRAELEGGNFRPELCGDIPRAELDTRCSDRKTSMDGLGETTESPAQEQGDFTDVDGIK